MLKSDLFTQSSNPSNKSIRSTDPNVLYQEVLEIFQREPVKHSHPITVAERIRRKYLHRLGGKYHSTQENDKPRHPIEDPIKDPIEDPSKNKIVNQTKEQAIHIDNNIDIEPKITESSEKSVGTRKKKKVRKTRTIGIEKVDSNVELKVDPNMESIPKSPESVSKPNPESIPKSISNPHCASISNLENKKEAGDVKVVSLSKIKNKIPMVFHDSDSKQSVFEWKEQSSPGWTAITSDHVFQLPTIACPDEKTWNYFKQSSFVFEPFILVPIQKKSQPESQKETENRFFVAKMKN